jgi:hypothetical protein
MITINNVKFASSKDELINSLFCPDGTASGWYKVNKHRVDFFKADGKLIACLTKYGVFAKASKDKEINKIRCSWENPELIGEVSWRETDNIINHFKKSIGHNAKMETYYFYN